MSKIVTDGVSEGSGSMRARPGMEGEFGPGEPDTDSRRRRSVDGARGVFCWGVPGGDGVERRKESAKGEPAFCSGDDERTMLALRSFWANTLAAPSVCFFSSVTFRPGESDRDPTEADDEDSKGDPRTVAPRPSWMCGRTGLLLRASFGRVSDDRANNGACMSALGDATLDPTSCMIKDGFGVAGDCGCCSNVLDNAKVCACIKGLRMRTVRLWSGVFRMGLGNQGRYLSMD